MASILTTSKRQFAFNRADHGGSFLRPSTILETRKAFKEGTIDAATLRQTEDAQITELIEQERAVGIKSFSDGEFRREYFHLDFIENLEGIRISSNPLTGDKDTATLPTISVVGRIKHVKPIQLKDFQFLQARIDSSKKEVVKVAIPSPTMVHFRGGRSAVSFEAYPNLDEFFEDLAEAYRTEIKILANAGCKYLQLDDTNLAYLCDLKMREAAAGRGEDLNTLPRQYAELINSALRDRPAGMTVGIHLCRGNFRSRHFAEGGYEPIAQVLFQLLNVDVYFLEFDTERAGTFEPLRFLPKGEKVVMLGLISSKIPQLEDKEMIKARIAEAAKYAPLEQLALSPQCGFSSTIHGNEITIADQWAKMRLVREIATEVWGSS
ncbi:Meth-synt-2 domain-containing protein [Mycena indigotica]|uniref:Meth-synt-2 domain-containing protein n=1 Tax=Mycena indigotica TaxID=2126181 RepID=A0A8H6T2U6_9AGAR|nr:Meth-synt-2 domain-containing protein [Mycena indigotica]KAF7309840.1 Meth-synt-2 domain-containing protein [Mycena indigotica]